MGCGRIGRAAADPVGLHASPRHQPVVKADVLLALGSFDPVAAVRAAELWKEGWAPLIVMSGGIAHVGGVLDTGWGRAEAEVFADIAVSRRACRPGAILLEASADQYGTEFHPDPSASARSRVGSPPRDRGRETLYDTPGARHGRQGMARSSGVPSMRADRRHALPGARMRTRHGIVHAMYAVVAHRIMVYPALGHQLEQHVPSGVAEAQRTLVEAGYTARLVPGFG